MTSFQDKTDFRHFGKSFQENLCRIILEDRQFADQVGEVLKTDFFELKYLKIFANKIYEYKKEFGSHPSKEIYTTVLRTQLEDENDAVVKQVRDFFVRIVTQEPDIESEEYIKKMSLDFCRKQNLKEAMVKSVKLLQSSSFDEISQIINEAIKLGSDNNFGYDYLKDFEKRFEQKLRNPVTTGWSQVDNITSGGLGSGELGVVVAPTGVGKSMALVHLAAQAVKEGKNVVYYTLELEDAVVAARFDSCITGIKLNDLLSNKSRIYDEVKDIQGHLIIKEYPTKSASTQTIKNHLEKLKQRGIRPDLIAVDYADLLKPVHHLREKRQELETIYEELRGIAKINMCPMWTASQTNRGGLSADVITMESISEAFNKCFVADFIISLSRSSEDKISGGGKMFVAKNRNGPDGVVYSINMDTSNVYIDVCSSAQNPQDVKRKAENQRQALLEKKYKDFKKGETEDGNKSQQDSI